LIHQILPIESVLLPRKNSAIVPIFEGVNLSMLPSENNKEIRLRHLLQAGLMAEEYGLSFYQSLADRTQEKNVKEILEILAREEMRHKAVIQETLDRWIPLPFSHEIALELNEELKKRGIFQEPPDTAISEEDMIRWAIDQEERMARFYQDYNASRV
jgi:rubrerythrin